MAKYVRNCYKNASRLFVTGGQEISSAEGTTHGDPFAMPSYAIGLVPMLSMLKSSIETTDPVKHAAYADDLGGAGRIKSLRSWWDSVDEVGLWLFPKRNKVMACC